MSKNYFLLLILLGCFIAGAQVKIYEYPSQILTEEGIDKLVEQSKQKNVSGAELKKFRELLYMKMKRQREHVQNGNDQRNGTPFINSSMCANPDFENGTNSGWTFASADINGVFLPCNTCPTGTVAINAIVNSVSNIAGQCTNGVDMYGSFPVVAPGGGTWSMVLNDANYMGKMQKTSYSFVVDPSNNLYTYQYAAVLNSGGHTPDQNPYFSVSVTDNTTGTGISCANYSTTAPASGTLPGWSISPICGGNACNSVYYKTWTTVSIDLSSVIGHTVTIDYVVSDCSNGGHFGYVYLDGSCGSFSPSNFASICSGTNANLCGPSGYSAYSWQGPVTGTTQCLSTSTPGTYTLNLTSSSSCPSPTLTYSVAPSSLPPPVISIAGSDTVCNGQVDTLTASGASTYVWTNGITNGTPFSPVATANYVVTATDANGCGAKDSITVVVQTCTTDLKNLGSKTAFKLFPNPVTKMVTIQAEEKLGMVLIYNSIGEIVLQTQSNSTKTEIDLGKLPAGIYTVKAQSKYFRLIKE